MAYLKKSEALESIKSRKQCVHGAYYTIFEAYLGVSPFTRKPIRKSARSIEKLRQIVNDFYKRLSSGGDAGAHLTAYQALDAKAALDMLEEAHIAMSLVDCVRAALEGKAISTAKSATTLGEAWTRYVSEHVERTSVANQRAVKSRVGLWVERTGKDTLLSSVTAVTVRKYLMEHVYRASKPDTATTYNKVLGDIHSFLRWCAAVDQKLLPEDPLNGMKKMEIGYHQPEYMKAADVARLFAVLEKHKAEAPADLADAILSFLCGMRQSEIENVREGEDAVRISLEDHFIRVIKCKGSTRGIRPRAFRIPEQAEAWMRSFDFMGAVRTPNPSFREHLLARAKEADIDLPKNAGRHTFITMYEAAHHDTNALSGIVGNTDAVRSKSYNGVELEREGKAYFAIMPKGGM